MFWVLRVMQDFQYPPYQPCGEDTSGLVEESVQGLGMTLGFDRTTTGGWCVGFFGVSGFRV